MNPGQTASMHWSAKPLSSTKRQNWQKRQSSRNEGNTSSVSQLCMCYWIQGLNKLSSLHQFLTLFIAYTFQAADNKLCQNILSFLTFSPWIVMDIQTEPWQWTSSHNNAFFSLLLLHLVSMEHSFCKRVLGWQGSEWKAAYDSSQSLEHRVKLRPNGLQRPSLF